MRNFFSQDSCGSMLLAIFLMVSAEFLLVGCKEKYDGKLVAVQSVIEEHPDSALMRLDGMRLPADAPEGDRALYGMLLTQARYKNFIDEDNDSLINISAEYFQRKDDPENAATSLYLAGYIQINAGKYGEAAISLRKGLDLARKHNLYMNEGRCAKGLLMLYTRLFDGSNQVRYAEESYNAFVKGGYEDWANYAKLDMAMAYNNNMNYSKSIAEAKDLIDISREIHDSVLLSESLRIMGMSKFAEGNYRECILEFIAAYDLDSSILTPQNKTAFLIAASSLTVDSLPLKAKEILGNLDLKEDAFTPFEIYSRQGDYENAYNNLILYKEEQDSILTTLLKNNVSGSVFAYERDKREFEREKIKYERIGWLLVILCSFAVFLFAVYFFRKQMLRKERKYRELFESAETIKNDLKVQAETNKRLSESVKELFRHKYDSMNSICSAFYEHPEAKTDKNILVSRMSRMINEFVNTAKLKTAADSLDSHTGGLYSGFIQDFPTLDDKYRKVFLYLAMGFSTRSISVFLDVKIEAVYNYKSRLKSKIEASEAARKEEYLLLLK